VAVGNSARRHQRYRHAPDRAARRALRSGIGRHRYRLASADRDEERGPERSGSARAVSMRSIKMVCWWTGMAEIRPAQQPFAAVLVPRSPHWDLEHKDRVSLLDVVRNAKPTALIGVSGQAGAFTEEVVRAMAGAVERPVIFPLSNPTSRSEAKPADLLKWTDGRALIGTGSPFAAGELEWPRGADRSDEQLVHLPWPGFGCPVGKRAAGNGHDVHGCRQMSRRTFSRSTQQVGTIVAAGFGACARCHAAWQRRSRVKRSRMAWPTRWTSKPWKPASAPMSGSRSIFLTASTLCA
jgi:hypothetical protein